MRIRDFTEKEIRNKIKSKLNPSIQSKRGSHEKGYIFLDGKLVTKVKIPNNHIRIMKPSKSSFIATALKLEAQEFNDLIECPLTGPQYEELLRTKLKNH
jgi:hypothetical protein